jgi:hypothetical protein
MKVKNKYYYILFIVLFALSCKKDNTSSNTFTSASYPLAVGNWWQYILTQDCCEPDTFMLSVTSATNAGSYNIYKCYYIYHGSVTDSAYFQQSDTSLSFMNPPSPYIDLSAILNFHLKLPASKGQFWPGSFPGDSIIVNAVVATYSAYGLTYGPCYYLAETYDLPHNSKTESMILTPKVGTIYQSVNFISDTTEGGIQIHQQLRLLNYHIQ